MTLYFHPTSAQIQFGQIPPSTAQNSLHQVEATVTPLNVTPITKSRFGTEGQSGSMWAVRHKMCVSLRLSRLRASPRLGLTAADRQNRGPIFHTRGAGNNRDALCVELLRSSPRCVRPASGPLHSVGSGLRRFYAHKSGLICDAHRARLWLALLKRTLHSDATLLHRHQVKPGRDGHIARLHPEPQQLNRETQLGF